VRGTDGGATAAARRDATVSVVRRGVCRAVPNVDGAVLFQGVWATVATWGGAGEGVMKESERVKEALQAYRKVYVPDEVVPTREYRRVRVRLMELLQEMSVEEAQAYYAALARERRQS